MLTDPIADLLTRIRNAVAVRQVAVTMPGSKLKQAVLEKMLEEGYIKSLEEVKDGAKKSLVVGLKYDKYGDSVIEGLQRVSKPGRRMYSSAADIPRVRSGLGTMFVSTSHGILTGSEARKQNYGGELICRIW